MTANNTPTCLRSEKLFFYLDLKTEKRYICPKWTERKEETLIFYFLILGFFFVERFHKVIFSFTLAPSAPLLMQILYRQRASSWRLGVRVLCSVLHISWILGFAPWTTCFGFIFNRVGPGIIYCGNITAKVVNAMMARQRVGPKTVL